MIRREMLTTPARSLVAIAGLLLILVSCVTPCLGTQGGLAGESVRPLAPGSGDPGGGGQLTVVTYNMLHGFGDRENDSTLERRLELAATELARIRPDVILLQEVSVTPGHRHCNVADSLRTILNDHLAAEGVSYGSVYYAAHGSHLIGFYEGSAILSLYPIVEHEKITYAAQSRTPPEHRIAVRATIDLGNARIDFYSTHLTNQDELRKGVPVVELQAKELATLVEHAGAAGRRLVVGGDFNAPPDSPAVEWMRLAGAVDAWLSAGGDTPGETSLRGSVLDPGSEYGRRIDYIFVGPARLTVLGAVRILDRPIAPTKESDTPAPLWPSDHAGVLATIQYW